MPMFKSRLSLITLNILLIFSYIYLFASEKKQPYYKKRLNRSVAKQKDSEPQNFDLLPRQNQYGHPDRPIVKLNNPELQDFFVRRHLYSEQASSVVETELKDSSEISNKSNKIIDLNTIEREINKLTSIKAIISNITRMEKSLDENQKTDFKKNILSKYRRFEVLGDLNHANMIAHMSFNLKCSIFAVALSKDKKLALTVHSNGIDSWNILEFANESFRDITKGRSFEKRSIKSIAFSPDIGKQQILIGTNNGEVDIWTLGSQYSTTLHKLNGAVNAISINPNIAEQDKFVVAVEKNITLFKTFGFSLLEMGSINHSGIVNCLTFSNDGKYMVSGDTKGVIKITELNSVSGLSNEQFVFIDSGGISVTSIDISPDLKFVLAAHNNKVILYNSRINKENPRQEIMGEFSECHTVTAVKFNNYSNLAIIASGFELKIYNIIDSKSKPLKIEHNNGNQEITSISIVDDLILIGLTNPINTCLFKLVYSLDKLTIPNLAFLIKLTKLKSAMPKDQDEDIKKILDNFKDIRLKNTLKNYIEKLPQLDFV